MRAIPPGWVPAGRIVRADGRIVRLVDPPGVICDCPPTIPLPVGRTRHGRHCGCDVCRGTAESLQERALLAAAWGPARRSRIRAALAPSTVSAAIHDAPAIIDTAAGGDSRG